MTDIHDIKPLETPDLLTLVTSICVIGFIFFVVFCFILYKLIKGRKRTAPKPSPTPIIHQPLALKDKYIKELNELSNQLDSGQYSLELIHLRLGEIIREFIYGYQNKPTLPKTKTELSEYKIRELDEVIKNTYRTTFELKTPDVQITKDLTTLIENYIKNAV